MVRRPGSSVENVNGVFGREIPEPDGRVASDKVGSNLFHDTAYRSFGHPVEGMDVRGAGGLVYCLRVEELLESARRELAGVVTLYGTYYVHGLRLALAGVGVERGDELLDATRRFRLILHEVHALEPCMVVYENEHVLVAADFGVLERVGGVNVNEAASVRGCVPGFPMG